MSDSTGIEWTDATWNPTRGCSRVSPGCENCYAERFAARFSGEGLRYDGFVRPGKNGPRWTGNVSLVADKLDVPLRWKRSRRVFVNSMSDLFHEALSDDEIAAVFGVMAAAPQHTFQVLTKRAERMRRWFEWAATQTATDRHVAAWERLESGLGGPGSQRLVVDLEGADYWPLPNVWLGVSVEDQRRADERIPHLLATPAAVRFLSCEPLLGPVTLSMPDVGEWPRKEPTATANPAEWDDWKYWTARDRGIGWVIIGGESGPGARPMDLAWARSIVGQCRAAGVPVFVKQLGQAPVSSSDENGDFDGAGIAGCGPVKFQVSQRHRKGGDMSEWPADLRVREFPR